MNTAQFQKEQVKAKRTFLPKDLEITGWDSLAPYFDQLLSAAITDLNDLRVWLDRQSELEAILMEDMAWRYIRMTSDTAHEGYRRSFQNFIKEVQPQAAAMGDKLNRKLIELPFIDEHNDPAFQLYKRKIQSSIRIFREENLQLLTEEASLQRLYGEIQGAMSVNYEGKELTMPQASDLLRQSDRAIRERVYHAIQERRLADADELDQLFDDLLRLRQQIALQADFPNYSAYKFQALGRFDYGIDECLRFHESVKSLVVPMLDELAVFRKQQLGLSKLRPYDLAVDLFAKSPLLPFDSVEQLTERTAVVFGRVDPYFEECLRCLQTIGQLDLGSRLAKAPGGYNYPLMETGAPFIFMNATSNLRDMVTLLHEGGHAVHSFLSKDLKLTTYKLFPSEIAELASMGMELITMDHWDVFFPVQADLRRAKFQHLEQIIQTLPWVATIDKFQHWIYQHPGHSVTERHMVWEAIFHEFCDNQQDFSNLEHFRRISWQKQLHLYEVPFYYIEYGIAQLGAIALWKNYREQPAETIKAYKQALALGYTKSIPELYHHAGIQFDFSPGYIKELMDFVMKELRLLTR